MTRRDRIREKIMARVDVDPVTGCWLWTGPDSGKNGRGNGYPRMWLDGQTVAVHIVMWTNEHGFIPKKRELDHACRNRLCVRPDPGHLEMVTHSRNIILQWEARKAIQCDEVSHGG